MTLVERLRAWLGGLFGSGDADDDGTDPESASATDGPEPTVVHRDDRPLETPGTMDGTNPPATGSGNGPRVDIPDAETRPAGTTPEERNAPSTESDAVSIPDAETSDESATSMGDEPTTAADEPEDPTPAPTPDAAADERDDSTDAAFACSVCGTTVDDPSEPCPLCRSTDVVPVADAAEADEPLTRGGRTSVSTADDEAVDRLRDVKDDE